MKLLPSLTRLHTERQFSKTTDIRLQKADLSFFFFLNYFNMFLYLTLFEPNPQNRQTNSKNSAKANKLSVFDHFAGLTL